MRIVGLAVLALVALIVIFVYDQKVRSKKKQILNAMWRIVKKTDGIVGMPVRKVKLMEECNIRGKDFAAIISRLSNDGILKADSLDSVEFTDYGKNYYEFKMMPEHNVRG